MQKRNKNDLLNMFSNLVKNKILSDKIEERKKEQKEKEIKKEKEKFERRKIEEKEIHDKEIERQKEYKKAKREQAKEIEQKIKEDIRLEKERKRKAKIEQEKKMQKEKEFNNKIQKHKEESARILENNRNRFNKNMKIKEQKVKENKERIQEEQHNKQEIKNIKKEEKFQKNINSVKKAQAEKIEKIQELSKIKNNKVQNYIQRIKEDAEEKQKRMKDEEIKQKQNMDEINKQRQQMVDEYYEKLKYEEMNPRPINKEKEERIEQLKYRNFELNERIKSANKIREKDLEARGEKIINDLKKKDLITQRIFEEKKIIASQMHEENEERYIAFEYKHQQLEKDKANKIDELREELDDKKRRVNEFLEEKQLIAKEARFISDQMTFQKRYYSNVLDNVFSKKGMDKNAFNKVKVFIAGDPKYNEICQYYGGQ